jgi:branched-chain amino acid transport system ATP-binding protein
MLLELKGVSSGYGQVQALHDVDLAVEEGEIVAVLGANGAGKSTLLRTISGLIAPWSGSIVFDGRDIAHLPAHDIVGQGIAMVPEGGRLFPFLTVLENLELGAYSGAARRQLGATLEEVLELFPILAERRKQLAGSLSGGERQMCAIARGVMSRPRLLMLDEPSLGLAPVMVERVFALIHSLASRQITILLVEQNVADALEMCRRAYILERGRLVKSGLGRQLLADEDVKRAYMGV